MGKVHNLKATVDIYFHSKLRGCHKAVTKDYITHIYESEGLYLSTFILILHTYMFIDLGIQGPQKLCGISFLSLAKLATNRQSDFIIISECRKTMSGGTIQYHQAGSFNS